MAVDIKKTEFDREVIQKSFSIPVLVDFWASWCQPCKALDPVLEKVGQEYENKFILVKVNTEIEQEIAAKYKVSSIPTVILFVDGDPKDQFVGALPENLIKNFLGKSLPHPSLKNIKQLVEQGKYEEAANEIILKNIKEEETDVILWESFKFMLRKNHSFPDLKKYIDHISDYSSKISEMKNQFNALFELNLTDLEKEKYRNIFDENKKMEILEGFINGILNASSSEEKEKNKIKIFFAFLLLGDDPAVFDYRKKLSRAVFS